MFCSKCGKQLADDANFCPVCGAAVKRDESVSEVKPAEVQVKEAKTVKTVAEKKKGKKKAFKIIIILAAIAAIISLVGYLVYSWAESYVFTVEVPDPSVYFSTPFEEGTRYSANFYSVSADNLTDVNKMANAYVDLLSSKYHYELESMSVREYDNRPCTEYKLIYSDLSWFQNLVKSLNFRMYIPKAYVCAYEDGELDITYMYGGTLVQYLRDTYKK
ncbi:MAG: zinc-ribbon domain-containing protein [Clostridia bacterium]|nr:zinc-ribbon domain-containing protein [Clostridia bacterium]